MTLSATVPEKQQIGNMTAAEEKYLDLRAEYANALTKLNEKYRERLDKALAAVQKKGCSHPKEAHQEFQFHHGYGKYLTGVRCLICNMLNHWPTISCNWITEDQVLHDRD